MQNSLLGNRTNSFSWALDNFETLSECLLSKKVYVVMAPRVLLVHFIFLLLKAHDRCVIFHLKANVSFKKRKKINTKVGEIPCTVNAIYFLNF